MARRSSRQAAQPDAVSGAGRRPTPKLVGFVGKPDITEYEAACLIYIGRCIQQLGHTLVIVPAPGAASALREGVEAQGGEVRIIEAGVLDVADRTLLYPDPTLLKRLERAYKDLHERENVVIIKDDQLPEWVDAMKTICDDYGIERP